MKDIQVEISKKTKMLIDAIVSVPTVEEIATCRFVPSEELMADHRSNVEDILLMVLERLTKNTVNEELGKELSEKARAVFDYYTDGGGLK